MPSTQIISNSNPQSNGNSGNENSNGKNGMPNMLNMVEMEQDLLNDHECMAPMMQLIKFMSNKKIYSSSDSQLPLWMNEIKVKIEDNDVHSNVKLFLLRLILNCHAEFEPFAKYFTSVILKTISSEVFWNGSPIINYFSLDLIVMLLSWSYIPDVTKGKIIYTWIIIIIIYNLIIIMFFSYLAEKSVVESFVRILAKTASEAASQREIMNYCRDVLKTIVEKWKSCLEYVNYVDMFNRDDDLTKNFAGIQILGYLLANNISPFQTLTIPKTKYVQDLAKNMQCDRKETYQSSGKQVCPKNVGLVFQFHEKRFPN